MYQCTRRTCSESESFPAAFSCKVCRRQALSKAPRDHKSADVGNKTDSSTCRWQSFFSPVHLHRPFPSRRPLITDLFFPFNSLFVGSLSGSDCIWLGTPTTIAADTSTQPFNFFVGGSTLCHGPSAPSAVSATSKHPDPNSPHQGPTSEDAAALSLSAHTQGPTSWSLWPLL